MVDVDKVAVELDVQVGAGLYGAVCTGSRGRRADACECGASRKGYERDGTAGEGTRAVVDAQETCEIWLHPGGDLFAGSGLRRGLEGVQLAFGGGWRGRGGR